MTKRLISMLVAVLMVLALVPVSSFARTEGNFVAPKEVNDPPVTYTGAVIDQVNPQVGSKFYFPVYVSAGSCLNAFDILVDYDENYLSLSRGIWNSTSLNSTYPQLSLTISLEGSSVSDNFTVANCETYVGGSGEQPVGEVGNEYARILGYQSTYNHQGVQLGGAIVWLEFEWTVIPAQSKTLPMPITALHSTWCTPNLDDNGIYVGAEHSSVTYDNDNSCVNVTVTSIPAPEAEGEYVLVTDLADIDEGDYVIYGVNADDPESCGAMTSAISNGRMGCDPSVKPVDGKIVNPPANTIWHLAKDGEGYTIGSYAEQKFVEITGDSARGFAMNAASDYGYTIAEGTVENTFKVQTRMEGNTRMISICESDFRPFDDSDWNPLYLYKYVVTEPDPTAEPTEAPEFDGTVTFTGEEKNAGTVAVGDSVTWDLSISAASHLYSGAVNVDYDERYLEADAFNAFAYNFEGSVVQAVENGDVVSDMPALFGATFTASNSANGLTAGNMYYNIGVYLSTCSYNGVDAGGPLVRLPFTWKEVPTATSEGVLHDENGYYLPMDFVIGEVLYTVVDTSSGSPIYSGAQYAEGSVTKIPGKIYFVPAGPQVNEVTFTGETKNVGEPAVNGALTWDLSISAASHLYSGAINVDYDERYLEAGAFSPFVYSFEGSVAQAVENGDVVSDMPGFYGQPITAQNSANGLTAGNMYYNIGLYLSTCNHNGVDAGGPLVRLPFTWKEVPTADSEGVLHDENGYYLPMDFVISEACYTVVDSTGSTPNYSGVAYEEGSVTKIPGKLYFTPAQKAVLTINYIYADGATAAPTYTYEYNVGDEYSVTSPEITGYTPDLAVVSGTIQGDLTVTVTYDADMHTVTVHYVYANGGEAAPDHVERVAYNAAYSVTSPEITGYTASQAVVSGTMGTENVEVTVTYTVNTYTLTVHYVYANGGEAAPDYVESVAYNAAYSVTSPEITGYTASQAVVSGTMGTENVEVTVTYTVNTYTVTFVDHDGTVLKTEIVAHGEAATAPTVPGWEGHVFTGWDKDFSNVTGDLTVTALYEDIVYHTVTFVDGLTNETIATVTVEDGAAAEAPAVPAHEGYNFVGWDPADFTNVTADMTVTAQYTAKKYQITVYYLRWSDGLADWVALQSPKTVEVTYGAEYDVTAQIPETIDDYVFDHTDGSVSGTMPAQNIEINAYYVIPAYVPVAPTVAGERVELRERVPEDGKTDLRFVFKITFNDSYVLEGSDPYGPTQEYYKITKFSVIKVQGNGSPKELVCQNLLAVNVDENYCLYSLVVKGIPANYNDLVFTMTPHIEYELDGNTSVYEGAPLTASVNSLNESDD